MRAVCFCTPAATLTLDECIYNDEYISCLRELFTAVKEQDIKTVVVDIRGNSGGSSSVVNEFIRYLDADSYKNTTYAHKLGWFTFTGGERILKNERYDDLLFRGKLYVLCDSATFSSAMFFAQLIKDNRLGTLVGQAPGNDPNGFGEIVVFSTPNTRLRFQVSTKRFIRADSECTDKLVMPDLEQLPPELRD